MSQGTELTAQAALSAAQNKRTWGNLIINVKDPKYGAKGDGVTDDTAAIQKAIDVAVTSGGGTVIFPVGTYKISFDITIKSATRVNIIGYGAVLLGGSIFIGDTNPAYGSSYIHVEGLMFDYANYPDSGAYYGAQRGIKLANASFITITRCVFQKTSEAIYIMPLLSTQHIKRVRMQNNIFKEVGYAFYVDNPGKVKSSVSGDTNPSGSTNYFFIGDCHFTNNQITALYDGIHGTGFDGFICSNNTFLPPGTGTQSTTKRYNIFIDYSNWVIIEDNNLFETGADAIRLNRSKHFDIGGNNIAAPGQVQLGSGIVITGGDYDGQKENNGTIGPNTISNPSKHGIEIDGSCGRINISPQTIVKVGSDNGNFSTTVRSQLSGITHYGISLNTNAANIGVSKQQVLDTDNNYGTISSNDIAYTIKEGKIGNRSVTTSPVTIDTITFSKPFAPGTTPTVHLTITGLAGPGQITLYASNITNTGFNVGVVGSVANTITYDWSALGFK